MIAHSDAELLFKKCKNKERGYLLAKHTRLQKRGHAFAIRYHTTDVVMIRPDGTYRLNSGGWRTPTTKNRMNTALPTRNISQVNGIWYVGDALYVDGILISPDGNAINGKPCGDIQKTKRLVDRQTVRFIKLVVQSCQGRDIGSWFDQGRKRTKPCVSSKAHLKGLWNTILTKGQMTQDYMFGLIYWAVLSRNYGNPTYIWDLIRANCYNNNHSSDWILSNMNAFMRPRKPLIAEMIHTGEMSN